MTQFPWMDRIIIEDEQGLLAWVDTNHYFYKVMSQLGIVNNDPMIADTLFHGKFRFLEYAQDMEVLIKKAEKYKRKYSKRNVVFSIIRDLISKYTITTRGDTDD